MMTVLTEWNFLMLFNPYDYERKKNTHFQDNTSDFRYVKSNSNSLKWKTNVMKPIHDVVKEIR